MGHGTKSIKRNDQSNNTYSFSSSGYSSQSLSEIDHNNVNKTPSSSNYTINTDFHVRTSTPTTTTIRSHDFYQYSQSTCDVIEGQEHEQQPTAATIYTIDTLDNNNNETPSRFKKRGEDEDEEKKGLFEAIFSFIFKIFTCFNLFNKKRNDDVSTTRSSSPSNSIYDNFNLDLQKYTRKELEGTKARCAQNYYEYRPEVYNKSKIIMQQQQISTIFPQYNQEAQIPSELIIEPNYYNPYYCNNHTRNSTFINNNHNKSSLINEDNNNSDRTRIMMKPYLSASSISSIELSTNNNNNKLRSYSVDSIINKQQQQQLIKTPKKCENYYFKASSIDSVVPTSVSTSLSSLETSESTSKKQQQYNYNLKYISPIVDNYYNGSAVAATRAKQENYYNSNNNNNTPNVMIHLEKMNLKRHSNMNGKNRYSNDYNLFQCQLPLFNPIYDDWICDKEVESYFENPVYFDCYQNSNPCESSNIYQIHNNNNFNNFNGYYNKKKSFKSESYC